MAVTAEMLIDRGVRIRELLVSTINEIVESSLRIRDRLGAIPNRMAEGVRALPTRVAEGMVMERVGMRLVLYDRKRPNSVSAWMNTLLAEELTKPEQFHPDKLGVVIAPYTEVRTPRIPLIGAWVEGGNNDRIKQEAIARSLRKEAPLPDLPVGPTPTELFRQPFLHT